VTVLSAAVIFLTVTSSRSPTNAADWPHWHRRITHISYRDYHPETGGNVFCLQTSTSALPSVYRGAQERACACLPITKHIHNRSWPNLTMAIYSSVPPPSQQSTSTSTPAVDIDAWTVSALQSLSVSPSARGTGVTLSIPLDTTGERDYADGATARPAYKPRKDPLLRRDSQRRREALLKGKEGSRRRQRWENGEQRIYGYASRAFSGAVAFI
jgi:hypothetical protein